MYAQLDPQEGDPMTNEAQANAASLAAKLARTVELDAGEGTTAP